MMFESCKGSRFLSCWGVVGKWKEEIFWEVEG